MSRPHILMCPPDHYGIEYEINAWMNTERKSDHAASVRQWQALRQALVDAGAEISELTPASGLPDMVFTANAGLVYKRQVFLSRFRPEQRRGEQPRYQSWFEIHGFDVQQHPDDSFFEGAGDALFCGDTLVAGCRQRSDAHGLQRLGEQLRCRVFPLELIDPHYYHIDTCFCPLAPGVAMYYPGAFDDYGRTVLKSNIETLIEIDASEATHFAANAVVVGNVVITNDGCEKLHTDLRAIGFDPVSTPLSEFVKAGGSAKCLTLRLDGEEAASWRAAQRGDS